MTATATATAPSITAEVLGSSLQEASVTIAATGGPAAVTAAARQLAIFCRTKSLVNSTTHLDAITQNADGTYTIRYF